MAKPRGRPKSKQTIAREATDAWLRNPPPHIKPMTKEKREEVQQFLDELEQQRKIMLSQHSRTIPDELIYAYESVGHRELFEETPELLAGEARVIKKYNTLVDDTKKGQKNGAAITAQKAHDRANTVWLKNQDIVKRIGTSHSVHSASQKILDEWVSRGDNGKEPSIRTIQNWYQSFISK
jgi:polyhydroxyalkanoate synthesis regulator phasin